MTPTVGRTVHYILGPDDADKINRRRSDAERHMAEHRTRAGEAYPLAITRVWPDDTVNGQVLLDGNDTLWVTSRKADNQPATWAWPPRT